MPRAVIVKLQKWNNLIAKMAFISALVSVLLFCLLSRSLADVEESRSVLVKVPTKETGSLEDRGRLLHDLFQNYDKQNYPTNITTRFSIALLKFNVDEHEDNVVEADIWLREMWTDPRLAFNPAEYGGISVLRVPRQSVWKPDVILYNAESGPHGMECVDTNVLIFSNGNVLGVPPCSMRAHCSLTLDTEPFGEQLCTLKFGSWTLDGFTMDLQSYKPNEGEMEYYQKNKNWEVTSLNSTREEKFYPCCKEPYVTINYDIVFHRKRN